MEIPVTDLRVGDLVIGHKNLVSEFAAEVVSLFVAARFTGVELDNNVRLNLWNDNNVWVQR